MSVHGHQIADEATHIDVFLESLLVICPNNRQNRTLGTALGDILVFEILRRSEPIVLVKEGSDVRVVIPISISIIPQPSMISPLTLYRANE